MLTTSQKITAAFIIAIGLMTTLAYLGYRGLTEAAVGYQNSNRLALIDISTSEALRNLNNTAYLSTVFLRTGDASDMRKALACLASAQRKMREAKAATTIPKSIQNLNAIEASMLRFETDLKNLQQHRTRATSIFLKDLIPAQHAFEKEINLVATLEYEEYNIDTLNRINVLWPTYSLLDTFFNRYFATQQESENNSAKRELAKLSTLTKDLKQYIQSPETIAAYDNLVVRYDDIARIYSELSTAIIASRNANVSQSKNLREATELTTAFKVSCTALRESSNVEFETQSNGTLTQTVTVTIIGLLITISFAIFIILSINSTFRKLSIYFTRIAEGDFTTQSGITEKGAIGTMIEGMQKIPNTLNAIIVECNLLANNVIRGHFRDRFSNARYSGGFATLGDTVNLIASTYTGIIDAIPAPIMVCDLNYSITFLNTPAQAAVGGNKTKQRCSDVFCAEACHTPNCFGTKSINSKNSLTGTTIARLGDATIDINVQAAPLFDQQGKPVAFIEAIADITELRDQQRLITKTASEAASIADRVASATDELSAQVEQTSRGTNSQKRQVESTASAMHEMNSTVLEVARNAGQTSTQTEETLRKAHDGAQLVDKVVHSINAVNNVANTLQSNMQELGLQADNIGSVMNTISDIADQTNLLALNAAIEAARAGDAGRGFAVVADEVRKLAEKTMNATHEVGQSISTIQSSIRVNISEVTNAVNSVTQATGLANSSGQALSEIVELVSSNSQLVSSIATGAEQQSATSDEINRALGEINTVVSEISSSMGQSSQTVGELSKMAQQLRSLMKQLS